MEDAQMAPLALEPEFDLEDFMNFTRESRISSDALEHFAELWETWRKELQAVRIHGGSKSWLAIWLPEAVETTVDAAWDKSPGEGFLINGLAQYMCMAAVEEALPQAAQGGCAPSPEPALALSRGLASLGLINPDKNELNLLRRYAILTYYPFKGGCEICAMREKCPKANGHEEPASVVLPGHERGLD